MSDNPKKSFYPNACFFCHRYGQDVQLTKCDKCEMIYYCNEQHDKRYWTEHEPLCKTIKEVFKNKEMSILKIYNVSLEQWFKMKNIMMERVETMLSRRLESYEREIFQFPKVCVVCHRREGELINCPNCASVSFCPKHKDSSVHDEKTCANLKICFDLDNPANINLCSNSESILSYMSSISSEKLFHCMHDFLKIYVNPEAHLNISCDLLSITYSTFITQSLTIFYGIKKLDYPLNEGGNMVVHFLEAKLEDTYIIHFWECLLHLLPILTMEIILIGVNVSDKNCRTITLCEACESQKKTITIRSYTLPYLEYTTSSKFKKPNIIVGFNVRVSKIKNNEPESSTKQNISEYFFHYMNAIFTQGCPIIFTSNKLQDMEENKKRLNTMLKKNIEPVYQGNNPFASIKPCRDSVTERVYFINSDIIIYKSLFS